MAICRYPTLRLLCIPRSNGCHLSLRLALPLLKYTYGVMVNGQTINRWPPIYRSWTIGKLWNVRNKSKPRVYHIMGPAYVIYISSISSTSKFDVRYSAAFQSRKAECIKLMHHLLCPQHDYIVTMKQISVQCEMWKIHIFRILGLYIY